MVLTRVQAEKSLKKTKDLLNGIFESIQDGICVLNSDLTFRYVNDSLKVWVTSDLPLDKKKCYEVFHKRSTPCKRCPVLRCMKTGKVEKEEIYMETELGGKWLEIYSYPLYERDYQEPTGVVESIRDITEKKESEERIRYLSFHDSVTGLYNRTYLEEEIKRLDVDSNYH